MGNPTLPGLSGADVARLRGVIADVYPSENLAKLGSWGILPLCCAAHGGQSQSWRATMIEINRPDDLIIASLSGEYPDYAVAWRFSQFLTDWIPLGLGLARARLDPLYREKGRPLSGRGYDGALKWTALAIVLNSLGELDTDEFKPVRTWAEQHDDGWLILFFGAGLHLSGDRDFPWLEMAGFLSGLDPRLQELLAIYVAQARNDRAPERLHGLERQRIVVEEIAQVGIPLFMEESDSVFISGECYAYEFDRLSANQHQPWHWTLMRVALVALATLRPKLPVLAAYELQGNLARLFLCANELRLKRNTHALLASVPGYIECGRDALAVSNLRPLAYWTPAATLAALWPFPVDLRPGPFAIDAGNLLEFRSYPEADHAQSTALDQAGPDYLRVPSEAEGRLDPEGISYVNRWAAMVYPDPAKYR